MHHSQGERALFENAKAKLVTLGINPESAVLSQSFLRFEAAIVAGKTNYTFGLLVNDNFNGVTAFNTEKRLNLQDSFFIGKLGVFLGVPSSATDATYDLLTYADGTSFSTSGAAASTNTLYNGSLRLAVNNRVILPEWDIARHKFVPETQPATGIKSQYEGVHMGFAPVEPNLVLFGSKNNQLEINLPAGITTIQANSRIIVMVRGVLAQNSTSVN